MCEMEELTDAGWACSQREQPGQYLDKEESLLSSI